MDADRTYAMEMLDSITKHNILVQKIIFSM